MDKDDLIASLTAELRDLRIRVAQIEHVVGPTQGEPELRARRAAEEYERSAIRAAASTYRTGDRIRITKNLRKPADWDNTVEWNQEQAQLATVTKVEKKQVWFITDNGINTWRAINNIKKVEA
jgi:hypothetical protein